MSLSEQKKATTTETYILAGKMGIRDQYEFWEQRRTRGTMINTFNKFELSAFKMREKSDTHIRKYIGARSNRIE